MYLGIEIGGTKLQLGVGTGEGPPLVALERRTVDRAAGAQGILREIEAAARLLREKHAIRAVGFGFGGPVDALRGQAVKSHHVDGWDRFPLADWCRETLGLPARVGNDCDVACLAEAHFGAGRGERVVLYVTVGTGIGGGLVIDGQIYAGRGSGAAEIGHLRPGLDARQPEAIVEALSAGWGIEDQGRRAVSQATQAEATVLRAACGGDLAMLSAKAIAAAAERGDPLAARVIDQATRALGWAIAQAVTLMNPGVVVIGGGVSQASEALWWTPLRARVKEYAFPPFADEIRLAPAALGEEVVVHGAVALARQAEKA
ncbi:MAG: ROK family protein [Pirellulales bacterium]